MKKANVRRKEANLRRKNYLGAISESPKSKCSNKYFEQNEQTDNKEQQ